ncbi:glycerol-3-phosphate dehydrogenase [Pseudoduganella umbonata]|uniref:Glycerol-3-phosphate dehydrogenase n=1 Tax=Pseudoduganella umbonata TaxID=864828 RepID=A0A4P8HN08_9BURK|nr:glycerol-3-phosphate dehydrogenase [Pseudoduganella umbonata]MBB3219708.1 glycerol-3-phosphate dehydrogenase [Pseudoduganella umbonata]QCP09758.1 glycerol-3-phosphate dehydrogenase [Pseudoduganella umbonata]
MAAARQDVDCDVLVVGGGINGAGIARDVAGRGLCVALCERDDLAAHTSSASTKLIHGGLRYLEHYEFGLVRKALAEREVLLRAAPHVIRPMRFVMPHTGQRSAALLRAGLFLYDRLARRELLPASESVQLACHPAGRALNPALGQAFVYSDGWVDDARLVVLNAVDAAHKGACVLTRTACTEARRENGAWRVTLRKPDGTFKQIAVRAIVNAAGPWAAAFLDVALGRPEAAQARTRLRLVKGSHIVVRRLFAHDDAYLFQHEDGRIVFAIPYERDFTLIGTTDVEYAGDPAKVAIDADEIRYLCGVASHYFREPVVPADVVWSYAGVRPLLDDASARASAVTRDYRLQVDGGGPSGEAPLLTVFGGKLTTYRKLAEETTDLLCKALGHRSGAWTAGACLPGGDLFGATPQSRSVLEFDGWRSRVQVQYHWLDCALIGRYARAYGTRIHTLLQGRSSMADMGGEVLPGLFEAELDYLRRHEWAMTPEDILWRRTKLGLHLPAGAAAQLDAWLMEHPLQVAGK